MIEQRNLVIGGLLLALVGGTLWLAQQSTRSGPDYTPLEHRPDYYLEGVDTTLMDLQGMPSQRLVTERMTHYVDDDSTELVKPHLTLYKMGSAPSEIRAGAGWMSGDGELVLLEGKVRIDRPAMPGVRPLHVITHDMRIQPEDNYAETDAHLEARSFNNRVTADGAQMFQFLL